MRDNKGWLIYDEAGIRRNQWFAGHLQEMASDRGMQLTLKELPTGGKEWWQLEQTARVQLLQELLEQWKQEGMPDYVIMRVIAPELTQALEMAGVRTFNNGRTARIANDKWLTYECLTAWGIPVLATTRALSLQNSGTVCRKHLPGETGQEGTALSYPVVVKAVAGHGGSQVYLAENVEQYADVLDQLRKEGVSQSQIIVQTFCDEPGKDLRVYVLGGEVYEAVLRSCETDFRSNFSLGGSIQLTTVTAEQKQVIAKLCQELQFDFVGVDFIRHQGQWVCNEIEDVVGTRMLYELTKKDAAAEYLDYIFQELSLEAN